MALASSRPSWNPLRFGGTELPTELTILVKVLALVVLLVNHVRILPDPWLPFVPGIDRLPPILFQKTLQTVFVVAALAILFNRRVRLASLVLGATMLLAVVSSKAYYGNNKTFCGLMFFLTGLHVPGRKPWTLQWQLGITEEDVLERLRGGVQLVLDPLGGKDWEKGYNLLAPAGQLIAFGWANMVSSEHRRWLHVFSELLATKRYSPMALMDTNRTVSGVNVGRLWDQADLMRQEMQKLLSLYEQKKIAPHVDKVFPLAAGPDAHRYIQERRNVGKVLFDCAA